MGFFDIDFDNNGEENYIDVFVHDDNLYRAYCEYAPLSPIRCDDNGWWRRLMDEEWHLVDRILEKAIRHFQRICAGNGLDLEKHRIVTLDELGEREYILHRDPEEPLAISYKPLGVHIYPPSSIVVDWNYIRQNENNPEAVFIIVLLHEFMHERMHTDKDIVRKPSGEGTEEHQDAYYTMKEESLANALTLVAIQKAGEEDLLGEARAFMSRQPKELGYPYGISLFEMYGNHVADLAEAWMKEKAEIDRTTKEKNAFIHKVLTS